MQRAAALDPRQQPYRLLRYTVQRIWSDDYGQPARLTGIAPCSTLTINGEAAHLPAPADGRRAARAPRLRPPPRRRRGQPRRRAAAAPRRAPPGRRRPRRDRHPGRRRRPGRGPGRQAARRSASSASAAGSSPAPASTPATTSMRDCLAASGCEVTTVAVRRERLVDKQGRNILDYLDLKQLHDPAQHGRLLQRRGRRSATPAWPASCSATSATPAPTGSSWSASATRRRCCPTRSTRCRRRSSWSRKAFRCWSTPATTRSWPGG